MLGARARRQALNRRSRQHWRVRAPDPARRIRPSHSGSRVARAILDDLLCRVVARWDPHRILQADDGAVWRVRVDPAGRSVAAPESWLTLPGRLKPAHDGLDFTSAGDRVLVTLLERGSDIWLVELSR